MVHWQTRKAPSGVAIGLLLLAILIAPLSAAADVFLATAIFNVTYAPDTFGRRLSFQTGYFTGGVSEWGTVPCSDTPVDDVVLVLDLPADTTLVSESSGSAAYDSVAGTVTWQIGTVQPCVLQLIDVTFDVDLSVPNGTNLEATASVTTTTPGDDPSDNQFTQSFVIGFLPLEVSLTFAEGECDSGSGSETFPNVREMSCGPGGGGGSAYFFPPPHILGYLATNTDRVRTGRVVASVSNRLNNDDVAGTVDADVYVTNPNPYAVRLRAHRDTHISCWVHNGTAETYIQDNGQSQFGECGFGNIDWMYEHAFSEFNADGRPGGECTVNVTGFSLERGSLNSMGSTPSCIYQSVGAGGQRLFRLDSFAGSATQSGHGAVTTSWEIGLDSSAVGISLAFFTVEGGSPVLLRMRDAAGLEVGAVDEGAGPITLADLPGSFYNGVDEDPQEIQLALPETGFYILEVLGTGVGPYAITLRGTGHGGTLLGEQVLAGQASNGSLDAHLVTLYADGTFAVPEPASEWMLGAGVALLLTLKQRRARRSPSDSPAASKS